MSYTRQDILELIEKEDVEFIRLQFTDIFGELKNVAVTTLTFWTNFKSNSKFFCPMNCLF